ncbi:hypothetical protein [Thalassotalea fusca]
MNIVPFNDEIAPYLMNGEVTEQVFAKPELSNKTAERSNGAGRFADELMSLLVTHQRDAGATTTLLEQSQSLIQHNILGFFSGTGFEQQPMPNSDQQESFLQRLQSSLQSSSQAPYITVPQVDVAMASENRFPPTNGSEASYGDRVISALFGNNGIDLTDGFDAVNVLHHIPFVSTVYQSISDADISTASKLAGGLLYGGPTGLAFSALDLAIENISGVTIGENILDFNYKKAWQSLASGLIEVFRTNSTPMAAMTNAANIDQEFATTAFSLARQLSR